MSLKSHQLYLLLALVFLVGSQWSSAQTTARLDQIKSPFTTRLVDALTSNSSNQCETCKNCECCSDAQVACQPTSTKSFQTWVSKKASSGELEALRDASELTLDKTNQQITVKREILAAHPAWLTTWVNASFSVRASSDTDANDSKKAVACCAANVCENQLSSKCCATGNISVATATYCDKVSELLAVTLSTQTAGGARPGVQKEAVEAALKLVAETTAAQARAQITELKAAHKLEMAELQLEVARLAMQHSAKNQQVERPISVIHSSNDQWQRFVQSLFADQTRSKEQLKNLASSQGELNQKVTQLAARLERVNAVPPQVIQNPLFQQPNYSTNNATAEQTRSEALTRSALRPLGEVWELDDESDLQRQISDLQSRMDDLKQYNVRRAGHLEPLYPAEKSLLPMNRR